MAEMTIRGAVQNTRNNVTDSDGYALPPLAANLKEGQIAVNTCETDPCIFFKTSEGKIVKIVSEEKLTKALTDILGNSAADLDTLRELIAQFEGSANDILPMLTALTDRVTAAETSLTSKADKSALNAHTGNTSNPHSVTKAQVGLSNVDNTADSAKPVSTAQATAIADAKKAGTDAQSNLTSHVNNKANPHGVTAAQVGALAIDGRAYDSVRLGGVGSERYARCPVGVSDLNTVLPTGSNQVYFASAFQPSGTSLPTGNYITGVRFRHFMSEVEKYESQLVFAAGSPTPYIRTSSGNGAFGAWDAIYHSGNSNNDKADWDCKVLTASSNIINPSFTLTGEQNTDYVEIAPRLAGDAGPRWGYALRYYKNGERWCIGNDTTPLWHARNSNLPTADWTCKNFYSNGKLLYNPWVTNQQMIAAGGTDTDKTLFVGNNTVQRINMEAYSYDAVFIKDSNGKIWNAGNSNKSDVSWACNNLTANKGLFESDNITPLTARNSGSDTNTSIAIMGKSLIRYIGIANGELRFGNTADLLGSGNIIWHAGNSNLSNVDWTCRDAIVARNMHVKGVNILLGNYFEKGNTNTVLGETTLSREIQNIGYRDVNTYHINSKIAFENYNNFAANNPLAQGGRIGFYAADNIYKEGDPTVLVAKMDTHTGLTVEKNVVAKGDVIAKKSGAVTFSTSDAAAGATRLNDLIDVKLPTNLADKMVLAYDPAQVNSDGSKGGYTFMPSAGTGTGTVTSAEIASLPEHNHNDLVYTSDERLKNNITDLKDRAIKMILSLAPKSFGWNDKAKSFGLNDSISYGLIAQEVEKVMPELVKPLGKEDYIGVDYIKIVPILIAGVQEQHKEIIALNQKLKTIQARANKAYGNETNNADEIANLKADNITLKAEIEELKMLINK